MMWSVPYWLAAATAARLRCAAAAVSADTTSVAGAFTMVLVFCELVISFFLLFGVSAESINLIEEYSNVCVALFCPPLFVESSDAFEVFDAPLSTEVYYVYVFVHVACSVVVDNEIVA